LKRSNRLVLLIGVFLAIVAFIGILLLNSNNGPGNGNQEPPVPTELPTVVATTNIPLGTRIRADQVTVQQKAIDARVPGAFQDVSQVVGKVVRQPISASAQLGSDSFGESGQVADIICPAGRVCVAVQVDQVSGVGTVIKTGDYVDAITGFTGGAFPVITIDPTTGSIEQVQGINTTSVKALLQGMQVMGTLLPPPPAQDPNAPPNDGTALTGQQQIVILSVTTQQAEVIKFAQLDGSITLVLRSPDDFIDPDTGEPIPVVTPVDTTGVILKTLVDGYGVVPPELVEAVLPNQ
jgi:Flp pilus assembly protein CpaB